jgi:hypothetical protein
VETILETILTNAGFAGALLAVCGWALWKKDQQVKDLQTAAVAREKELGERIERLTTEYTGKLTTLAEARTADLTRVLGEERETNEKNAEVMLAVNTTLTQILGVMSEVRADVRRRSSPNGSPSVGGT